MIKIEKLFSLNHDYRWGLSEVTIPCSNGLRIYQFLWQQAVDCLLLHSSEPPAEPSDLMIRNEIPDTDELLKELKAFCRNPNVQTKRFEVDKKGRDHPRKFIKDLNLDVDDRTQRKGRS